MGKINDYMVSLCVLAVFCVGFVWGRVWSKIERLIVSSLNATTDALNRFTDRHFS